MLKHAYQLITFIVYFWGQLEGLEICQDVHSLCHTLDLGKSVIKSLWKQLGIIV